MENFASILDIANTQDHTLWDEGIWLLNWADKNVSEQNKRDFVDHCQGSWEILEQSLSNCTPDSSFEGAPSWDEIRKRIDQNDVFDLRNYPRLVRRKNK